MDRSCWSAALLAMWLGAAATLVSQAKPPDLPAANDVRCEDGDRPGPGQPRLEVETTDQAAETAPIWLDGWCPSVLPFILQNLCERLLTVVPPGAAVSGAEPQRDARTDDVRRGDPVFAATADQARRLYELAARCAREGRLEEARTCLRRAHLANPTCRFGQLAMQRLQELEAIEPAEEASEPPPPPTEPPNGHDEMSRAEKIFRRVRQTTQPLGLVYGATY